MKKQEPTMITDWLDEYGDPEIYKKVERDLELREAAEKYSLELLEAKTIQHHEKTWIESMFINGAKWQAERMYSEADQNYLDLIRFLRTQDKMGKSAEDLLEQFKMR